MARYSSMAAKSRFTASRSEQFGICAPAAERLPPPPSVSSSTCTFTLPMLRADTATPPSPVGYKTALAFTPEMFKSSSAACAATMRFCVSCAATTAMPL